MTSNFKVPNEYKDFVSVPAQAIRGDRIYIYDSPRNGLGLCSRHLQRIEDLFTQTIENFERNHITPLRNKEKILCHARLKIDSVATVSACVGLASVVLALPCLIGTAAASLSMVGTWYVDGAIHYDAETQKKQFMTDFMERFRNILNQAAFAVFGEDEVTLIEHFNHRMHNDPDPLSTFAHALFVAGEVYEHLAAPLLVATTRTLGTTVGFARVIKSAYPAVEAGAKVLPILGVVFSAACLAHSAVHLNHSGSMVTNMESFKSHLETLLRFVRTLQDFPIRQLLIHMMDDDDAQ